MKDKQYIRFIELSVKGIDTGTSKQMKIYEELGLTKDQYIYRIRKGLLPRKKRKNNERFSGLEYKNSPEKIKEIKEKYKNGVTEEIIKEMFL